MRKKIICTLFLGSFFIGSYAATNSAGANCFRRLGWCKNMAENDFWNSSGTAADEEAFVSAIETCLDEYGICADPPRN